MLWDDMPEVVDKIHSLLIEHQGPVLIYSHCEEGTDRTGEISGGYYLKYRNMTFAQALSVNNHVQSRDM